MKAKGWKRDGIERAKAETKLFADVRIIGKQWEVCDYRGLKEHQQCVHISDTDGWALFSLLWWTLHCISTCTSSQTRLDWVVQARLNIKPLIKKLSSTTYSAVRVATTISLVFKKKLGGQRTSYLLIVLQSFPLTPTLEQDGSLGSLWALNAI